MYTFINIHHKTNIPKSSSLDSQKYEEFERASQKMIYLFTTTNPIAMKYWLCFR